ncbi:uncharacterized protein FOMMEDRAFT_146032 [Fomitiporia mediterranea MF3/22]|uniref:uncharacterized protein n=1 Tax=Fomitiporia mediterranea (strain MF3/22) TaxID=694068 RepID=UPI000440960C|nr:uncharacterized protein FOMMEDRAFT_146032 [Fomitiporia mediterranea MF3/22]EJD03895.1 hypothetical protein FOMMEDRAFT_146032 [Fomitiporia mediterranea MF3/22]
MTSDATQSVVASSSTLWAQASKEWVIPAKPKPGRKPKKDAAPPKEAQEVRAPTSSSIICPPPSLSHTMPDQVDSKGRRVQNRAAQRAFRERKQSQLADLQARLQSYEQGEIERNVALQKISKRLKEENEQLRNENTSLKEEISRLKEQAAASSAGPSTLSYLRDKEDGSRSLKRWRDGSVCSILSDDASIVLESANRKRFRTETVSPGPSVTVPQYAHEVAYTPSPPSAASSPDSYGISRTPFSPSPFATAPAACASNHAASSYPTSSVFSPPPEGQKSFDALARTPPFDAFDCGLCTDNTPCVCREIAMQHANAVSGLSGSVSEYGNNLLAVQNGTMTVLKAEDSDNRAVISTTNIIKIPSASDDVDTSRSPNPAIVGKTSHQYSVQSRQETLSDHRTNTSGPFQIRLPSPEPAPTPSSTSSSRSVPLRLKNARRTTSGKVWQINPSPPTCSGDPSNCPACKDDDFGKAFCRALGDSASVVSRACASCPNPEACGRVSRSACAPGPSSIPLSSQDSSEKMNLNRSTSSGSEQDRNTGEASLLNSSGRSSATLPSHSAATNQQGVLLSTPSRPGGKSVGPSETIPVNEAWARLKSHPNIAFADLSMLADVVARRTKCSGPVAVINPAPGSVTPERDAARSPASPESGMTMQQGSENPQEKDSNSVLLTDPHAHFREQEQQRAKVPTMVPFNDSTSSSAVSVPQTTPSSALSLGPGAVGRPALVPQEELRECGRRRIREVDAAGVREALRILDAQFGKHS